MVELCLKPSILVLKSHTSLLLPRFRSAVDQLEPLEHAEQAKLMAIHRADALFVTISVGVAVVWVTIGFGPELDFD